MKILARSCLILVFSFLLVFPSTVMAWNSGVHILVAEEVTGTKSIDLAYGSIAPDLTMYGSDPSAWPTGFWDAHYGYIDLSCYAWGFKQKQFARGWYSHNELNGADWYAHIYFPVDVNPYDGPGSNEGYVIQKAKALSVIAGVDEMVAHFAVEAAVDIMVADNYVPDLGYKLFGAAAFRSWRDVGLLWRVLVVKEEIVDTWTLLDAERNFRDLIMKYGLALAQPSPQNLEAVSQLGSELSQSLFGTPFDPAQVQQLLEVAMALCPEYWDAIQYTIGDMKGSM